MRRHEIANDQLHPLKRIESMITEYAFKTLVISLPWLHYNLAKNTIISKQQLNGLQFQIIIEISLLSTSSLVL